MRGVERWRRVIGHDGYLLAELRLLTPAQGGRGRAVQSGYHAQWWWIDGQKEQWVGSGPLDVTEAPSIKPGTGGAIRLYPMNPAQWQGVGPGSVLHLRERVGQTLGVATVHQRIDVPDHADLDLSGERLRPGAVYLEISRASVWARLRTAISRRHNGPT